MRAIGFVALLFLASVGIAVQGEENFTAPQPYPVPREPAVNPSQHVQPGQLPIALTAQVFYLEKATNIALESQEISKRDKNSLCLASDQEFEGFLKRLTEAGAIREKNSVSFLLTDSVKSTPIECSSNASTPAGKRSFQVELSASVIPPGRSVKAEFRLASTFQATPKITQKLEIANKFVIEHGKSMVFRVRFPEQVCKVDSEYLVRITQEPQPQSVIFSRVGPISQADRTGVRTGK